MTDLFSFLNNSSLTSDFKATLSKRGGYITFSNSGRRGSIKYFQIGLDNVLQTLKDILNNLDSFKNQTEYDETSWRNNGSLYFSDQVANANSTVQTKPLFSTLSKVIIWANQPFLDSINSDSKICLDKKELKTTIEKLEKVADSYTPTKLHSHIPSEEIIRQQIFYGAPGTGKSHKIKKYLEDNQIPKENVFRTTFHPDSDYSTFVGAYKPSMAEATEAIYTKEQLISKLTEMKNSGTTYAPHKFGANYWQSLKCLNLSDKKDILQACGMSDNYTVEFDKGIAIGEEFTIGQNETNIVYSFVPQVFLKAYMRAYQTSDNVYLVIEEINRGNCAQIFGDLFQLLDRNVEGYSDYTIKADEDLKLYLKKELKGDSAKGIQDGELCLPPNLYIFATMNTSDQSLFPIDSAFKRRWDWEYEPIKYSNVDWKIVVGTKEYSWISFQKIVNDKIFDINSSEDKMLGDFFINPSDGIITENVLLNKILFYLWNDVCKDGEGDIFKIANDKDVTFSELHSAGGAEKLIAMMDYLGVNLL